MQYIWCDEGSDHGRPVLLTFSRPWTDSVFKPAAVTCPTFLSCWSSLAVLCFLLLPPPPLPPSSNGTSVHLPADVEWHNVSANTLSPAHAFLSRWSLTAVMLMEKVSAGPDTDWPLSQPLDGISLGVCVWRRCTCGCVCVFYERLGNGQQICVLSNVWFCSKDSAPASCSILKSFCVHLHPCIIQCVSESDVLCVFARVCVGSLWNPVRIYCWFKPSYYSLCLKTFWYKFCNTREIANFC